MSVRSFWMRVVASLRPKTHRSRPIGLPAQGITEMQLFLGKPGTGKPAGGGRDGGAA